MTTHEVTIYKQNLPLMSGESTNDFARAIEQAATKKLQGDTLSSPCHSSWTRAIFSDNVVMSVSQQSGPSKLAQMSYKRDKQGAFTFGEPSEVKSRTSYVPVATSVTKSGDLADIAKRAISEIEEVPTSEVATEKATFWNVL